MSGRAISDIINEELSKSKSKSNLTITKQTTNKILLKHLGKPMKLRKTFYLTEKDKNFSFSLLLLKLK